MTNPFVKLGRSLGAFALVTLPALLSTGCASLNYRAVHVAAYEPNRPVATLAKEVVEGDIPFDGRLDAVSIFPGETIDGFAYDKANARLEAAPGTGNVVVDHVRIDFPLIENPALNFWFVNYRPEESWRRGLCYPQVPLVWITLGIWGVVPTFYPCPPSIVHGAMREIAGREERARILTSALRAEALRKGGNAVVGALVTNTNANGWIVRRTTLPEVAPRLAAQ